ncbi:MAG: flippase [Patescibacteria group bacterium]
MSLTRKVATSTIIQVISRILQTIGGLILLKMVAQYLGVAGIGELTTVFAYVGLVGIFADMGFFLILVREIAQSPKQETVLVNNVITLRSLFSLLLFLVGFAIVWLLSYSYEVKVAIGIYSLASFWPQIGTTIAAVFQSRYRIDKAAAGDILRTVASIAGVALAIRLDAGLVGVFVGYLVANVLGFLLQFALLQHYVRFRVSFDLAIWRRILVEALPFGLVAILGFVYLKIDTVLLSLMKSSVDVGIYGPSFKIMEVAAALPAYFMSAVMPIYSRYAATKDPRLVHIFQRSFDVLVIAAVPVVIGTILVAQALIPVLATDEFVVASTVLVFGMPATAATALSILIVTCLFLFANHSVGYLLIAGGYQRELIGPYLGIAIFNIVANLLLIPNYSYVGTSVTTVLTEVLVLITSLSLVHRHFGLQPVLDRLGKALLAGALMAIPVYLVREHILLAVGLGALSYGGVLYALKGITKDDIAPLFAKSV